MTKSSAVTAGRYELPGDRYYDVSTHFWILPMESVAGSLRARLGFDPLGIETCGDVVALSLERLETRLARGDCFGLLEAAKFVGPLTTPVAGRLLRHNTAVLERPALLNEEPLSHWLIEVELAGAGELDRLLNDPEAICLAMEREIERFEREGLLAE